MDSYFAIQRLENNSNIAHDTAPMKESDDSPAFSLAYERARSLPAAALAKEGAPSLAPILSQVGIIKW